MENIAIPIDLTAFALTPSCCDGLSKIAPITRPDYIGLRLDESLIQHDVLDHADFHLTSPATKNLRLTDLGTSPPELRQNRLGVYLHWSLPRLYRAATQYADSSKVGPKDPPLDENSDRAQPVYPKVPNRWLVVRRLSHQEPAGKITDFQTWVVESDRMRRINDIPDDVDLETDVTPFVAYDEVGAKSGVLATQAEIFIGQRHEHSGWDAGKGWKEDTGPSAKFLDLTIMNAANPLFPDYAPHNASVFSIVDSFAYKDAASADIQHLTAATADYFVIGWHSNPNDGPLSKNMAGQLRDRLSSIFLETKPNPDPNATLDPESEDAKIGALLDSQDPANVLIHGGIYNVKYDVKTKPRSLADEAALKFTSDVKMEPLSMGTTPLDAVLTFLEAHQGNIENVLGPGTSKVTGDILQLATLLYAADDSYDSRVKAQDLLYTNNWASSQGGFQWKFDGKAPAGKPPVAPTKDQVNALKDLNELQALLDTSSRKLKSRRWALFAEWWKFVSDRSNYNASQQATYAKLIDDLKKEIGTLLTEADDLQKQIGIESGTANGGGSKATPTVPCKKVPLPTYFTKKDPSLCIAGLDSGWPVDFLNKVTIKFDRQLLDPADPSSKAATFGDIFHGTPNPIPETGKLRNTATKLIAEFLTRIGQDESTLRKGYKQWCDEKGNPVNPFAPMFIEWEALYYHVDRTKWDVGVRPSPVGHAHSQTRFSIKDQLAASNENQKDFRWLSGRVLILPQPVFSLQAIVEQVLDNAPPDFPLTQAQIDEVKSNVSKLNFISAPLDGLTQHLLTRYMGTHVTPNVRVQGKKIVPLQDAVDSSDAIKFGPDGMALMDAQVNVTPYGNLSTFDPSIYTGVPFKGVTHGQMMLTKLNIVDKFGQAICVPPPHPQRRVDTVPATPPPAVYPCLSDYLTPDVITVKDPATGNQRQVLNTIYGEPDEVKTSEWPLCRFIQLTPSINQEARINATFLTRTDSKTYPFWRETIDDVPESPIFGWIVINYQDYGLQFFLPDGTFYREVRVGGPTGSNAGRKWLPFNPPDTPSTGTAQLDELIALLIDPHDTQAAFLQGFFDMINSAIKTMPYPPSDYSAFANSLVGKPLALVNVGWSLELSSPALETQNTLGNLPTDVAAELAQYSFPFKIGDADRPFDGVVGYWHTDNTLNGATNWNELFTYFPSAATSKTISIQPHNFPTLSPTYIDPSVDAGYPVAGITNPRKFSSYTEARTAQYNITTMLIDPYTPLHAYSPILPIKSLALPNWTVQKAFTCMTAFFRLGPSLLSKDVPTEYDKKTPLNADSWFKAQEVSNPPSTDLVAKPAVPVTIPGTDSGTTNQATSAPAPVPAIRLPISGKKGLWQWLQPYETVESGQRVTRYNALGVEQEDSRIRRDPAPYTFVEGYLQLARPLLKDATL